MLLDDKILPPHSRFFLSPFFLNTKSALSPLFDGPEVLSSASDKAKWFAKKFFKNSKLDDSGISLTVFPSRTNLKLHIPVTPKMKLDIPVKDG